MSCWRQAGRRASPAWRQIRRPLARIAAFGLLPAASLLSNLIVLPIISARFGQAGWSSVLLGQSIGAAASVVCALSWPMEGADLTSRATPAQRPGLYRASVRQCAAAVAMATPVVVGVCLAAEPSMPLVSVLSALALALNALSPGWYFVGVSRPSQLLAAEGGPRILVNLAAIGLVAFLPLWSYPLALIVGMLVTVAITSFFVCREGRAAHSDPVAAVEPPPRPIGGRVPVLAVLARGADAGSSYMTAPLVALVAAPAYPLYAAVDKLNQALVNVMGTATRGLTAWIAETGERGRRRRLTGAVLLAVALAGLSLAVLPFAVPMLLHYLFAGTLKVTPSISFLAAAIISGTFLSKALPLVLLVPQGQVRPAYSLLIVGACLALPLIGLTAVSDGSVGALVVAAAVPWGLVAAQLAVGFHRRPVEAGSAAG